LGSIKKSNENGIIGSLSYQTKLFLSIFEEYLPQHASSSEWVKVFLDQARKVLTTSADKTKQYQREFESSVTTIYSQVMNDLTRQQSAFFVQPGQNSLSLRETNPMAATSEHKVQYTFG
jgi:hypothetical protein